LPLLFVLLFHLPLHPSIVCISGIVFLNPHKGLVGCKILPIAIEFQDFLLRRGGISESLKFPLLLFKIFSGVEGLCFL
jgi:hypothetical protein